MIRRIRNVLEGWLFAPATSDPLLSWPRRVLRYPYALLRDLGEKAPADQEIKALTALYKRAVNNARMAQKK